MVSAASKLTTNASLRRDRIHVLLPVPRGPKRKNDKGGVDRRRVNIDTKFTVKLVSLSTELLPPLYRPHTRPTRANSGQRISRRQSGSPHARARSGAIAPMARVPRSWKYRCEADQVSRNANSSRRVHSALITNGGTAISSNGNGSVAYRS